MFIDLTGQKFGRLTVIGRVKNSKGGTARWLCKCGCGNEKIVRSDSLKNKHTRSCGCLHEESYWTENEINILKQFYANKGPEHCSKLINRTKESIMVQAQKLNLTVNYARSTGLLKKSIIEKLSDKRVISTCKIHGQTPHYYHNNKIRRCLKCRNIREIEYNKNILNNLVQRLRSRISHEFNRISENDSEKIIGGFRHLDYTKLQLINYLKNIQQLQKNKCPICHIDYKEHSATIEHVIPLKRAKTREEIINLFDLKNLNLMCGFCNSSKGKKDYNTWLKEKRYGN